MQQQLSLEMQFSDPPFHQHNFENLIGQSLGVTSDRATISRSPYAVGGFGDRSISMRQSCVASTDLSR
jgi:hypothetical protein